MATLTCRGNRRPIGPARLSVGRRPALTAVLLGEVVEDGSDQRGVARDSPRGGGPGRLRPFGAEGRDEDHGPARSEIGVRQPERRVVARIPRQPSQDRIIQVTDAGQLGDQLRERAGGCVEIQDGRRRDEEPGPRRACSCLSPGARRPARRRVFPRSKRTSGQDRRGQPSAGRARWPRTGSVGVMGAQGPGRSGRGPACPTR